MEQLILHGLGDYIFQSDWMANNKTKSSWAAFVHAYTYSSSFLLIGSWVAVLAIFLLHFLIDRWRLAVYVVWLKNILGCPLFFICLFRGVDNDKEDQMLQELAWANCSKTGYPSQRPEWMAVWLLIIADNVIHLGTNYLCLRYL